MIHRVSSRLTVPDLLLRTACGLAGGVVVAAFLWILIDLLRLGLPHIDVNFLTSEVELSGRAGGIGPILVSTLLILVTAMLFSLPVGFGSALWLSEFVPKTSRRARIFSGSIDLLASIPSIVFGLFGLAFFCHFLGLGFSILSGGLTLACMILPLLLRTSVSAMQSIPADLRPAASALGLSRTTTLFRILLPRALPGLVVGSALGIARALSETAALIFTSGYATRWPGSLGDSGRAISVHIYDLAMNIPNGAAQASASALVLLLLLLVINGTTSFLATRWTRKQAGQSHP